MDYQDISDLDIAIIGMSGRFPGSKNIHEFWQHLRDGVEGFTTITEDELRAELHKTLGYVPEEELTRLLSDPRYINVSACIDDIDLFDAAFFGYGAYEAEVMDPQQRLFLESSWEALEDAGYTGETYNGLVGVYAGAEVTPYHNVHSSSPLISERDLIAMLGNESGYLTTRVSYKLSLKGPSFNVQSACSTSLVAVHVACQSLRSGECDMALAGGVVAFPIQKIGYVYKENGLFSADGHCRSFDEDARGSVFAHGGVGCVVLKPLRNALAEGDHIYAVIKGSAVNNDGAFKNGYTAPSIDGQKRVLTEAFATANVEPDTLSYIETHGSATPLGDPIEVTALTQAFRRRTARKQFCAIGSVKSNIGHLGAAAGVAGLIKTVLALQHQQLPPSLHYVNPNPQIDFTNSPFYVNQTLTEWPAQPRRAGVSSFGIGGTNAHIVLEEAPDPVPSSPTGPYQLLTLSAQTASALETISTNLLSYLESAPADSLADVAYTLQVGRKPFPFRRTLICQGIADARNKLASGQGDRSYVEPIDRPVAFLFPGQGAQYVEMGRALYEHEPIFREHVDRCLKLLRPYIAFDLHAIIYPSPERSAAFQEYLARPSIAQPALFVIEYALAQLWMKWGVKPFAMIGHSIGEYVAACLAGVFSLEDALKLVALQGQLMQELPGGSMLSVELSEQELLELLTPPLSLAAVNGETLCVVSGPTSAIEAFEQTCRRREVATHRLHTSHAFHSEMMEPLLERFASEVGKIERYAPALPYISNVTGTWISEQEATSPAYWASHLRRPVRFFAGLTTLLNTEHMILLEIGPGNTLTTFVERAAARHDNQVRISSLRHPQSEENDSAFLLSACARLWCAGAPIRWQALHEHTTRKRLSLPTYPFERKRYWSFPHLQTSTNKVLEEASLPRSSSPARPDQLLLLSARTTSDLERSREDLLAYLQQHEEANLADIAYTLQADRHRFEHRLMLACRDSAQAITDLAQNDAARVLRRSDQRTDRPVVFLFPGVGEQYPGMARELFAQQPFFQQVVQECCQYLQQQHGLDLLPLLQLQGVPAETEPAQQKPTLDLRSLLKRGAAQSSSHNPLRATELAHPAVFVLEYAMARLLQHWGVVPQAVMGYSLGEYVAACVSGALSWQDALSVVTERARLIARLPEGKMLAVMLSEDEIAPYLHAGVGLAAVNAPQTCVLAGAPSVIDAVAQKVQEQGRVCREVEADHAFHTAALQPAAEELRALLRKVKWQEPTIPYVSNVTGQWMRAEEVRNEQYWVRQMCETVRWKDGVGTLLEQGEQVIIEVGAGQALSSFVRQHERCSQEQMGLVLDLVPAQQEREGQMQRWWSTLGKLWLAGGKIDWEQGWQGERRQRLVLPTYPFEHENGEGNNISPIAESATIDTKNDVERWFYAPTWKRADAQMLVNTPAQPQQRQQWLVFVDTCGIGTALTEQLSMLDQDIITVTSGKHFAQLPTGDYVVNPYNNADYNELFQHLQLAQKMPQRIVHLWNISMTASAVEDIEHLPSTQYHGFYSLLFLVQALGRFPTQQEVHLLVCTNNTYDVVGGDILYPEKATVSGLCTVLTKEYPHLHCRCIDVALTSAAEVERRSIAQCCLTELQSSLTDEVVAYRAGRRWLPVFEPIALKKATHKPVPLREKGVYLITGGLGGLGRQVADYLAKTLHATLILLGRTAFPAREQWSQWLSEHPTRDPISENIRHVQHLEEYGATVSVMQADVTDIECMQEVIGHIRERSGRISGVFHLAGIPGNGLLQAKRPEEVEQVFAAKIQGTLVLQKLLRTEPVDFLLLYSSSVAVLGGLGEGDYAAANTFLDALAHYNAEHGTLPTYSVNWGLWHWDSWQEKFFAASSGLSVRIRQLRDQYGITFQEGEEILPRILAAGLPQLLVLPQGLEKARQQVQDLFSYSSGETSSEQSLTQGARNARPALRNPYVAPSNTLEHKIATIWQDCLGIERIGIHDHFFELGGNSLLGLHVIAQLEKELGTQLSVAVLFEYPTIAFLAATLGVKQEPVAIHDMQMSSSRGKMRKERLKTAKKPVQHLEKE